MFESIAAVVWFGLSVLLFVTELFVPGVLLIWFSIPAFLVAGLLTLGLDLALLYQLLVFAFLSVPAVFLGLRLQKRVAPVTSLNKENDGLIGRHVSALDDFKGGQGRIHAGGTLFRASGKSDIRKDDLLVITGFSGNTALVEKSVPEL